MLTNDNILRHFPMGKVVRFKLGGEATYMYGHIVGFSMNTLNEVIIKILCADGVERLRHSSQVVII